MFEEYYKILNIPYDSTEDEIKKSYKKLAMKYHPDKQNGKTEKEKKLAEEEFKKISEAYEILTNKDKYFNKRNLNGNSPMNTNHIFQELFKNMHINSQNFSTNININNSISRVSQVSIVNGQRVEIISETINGVTRQRKIITPLNNSARGNIRINIS